MKLSTRLSLVTAVVVTAVGGTLAAPVQGSIDDQVVSDNPVNFTPKVLQGAANSIAQVGQITLVGGKFTTVSPSDDSAIINRTNIFAFDSSSGAISDSFVPGLDGVVNRVLDAPGTGPWAYIAGEFNNITEPGESPVKRSKVALINVETGALDPGFVPNPINGKVTDMVLRGGTLYISGAFTKVGPVFKSGVAALNATTGKDTGQFVSSFSSTFNGGSVTVKAIDVSPDGSRLVAIGNFRTVDGQSRVQIVVFNTAVSPAVVSQWATTRFSSACSSSFDTYMRDVSIAPDGSWFAVVTTGAYAGGVTGAGGIGTMCDAASRWELSPEISGINPTWVDYSGGDTLTAALATSKFVYVGGHQRWMNNPFRGDGAGAGAVDRLGLSVLDQRNGLPLSWDPTRARKVAVKEFTAVTNGLWIAHDSNRLGHEDRRRVAFMPLAGGTTLPAENTGGLPGHVFSLGRTTTGGDEVIDRTMSSTAVTSATEIGNGGQDWSSSRGAFMIDGDLYNGWSNGTLTVREFDGTNFGPAEMVDLHGLTAFASDLVNTTGMFYDRVHGRLYYTTSTSDRLYYRYFLPESEIVGAVRFEAAGPGGPINWSRAGGMFLAGGQLYVADRLDGTLRMVSWNGTGVTGSATQISGPGGPGAGQDGQDWRARSTFLLAP